MCSFGLALAQKSTKFQTKPQNQVKTQPYIHQLRVAE